MIKTLTFCMLFGASSLVNAMAQDFSFTGNLNSDDDVQLFDFTVGNTSTVTLKTLSYAGGTNAEGTVISAGGFDPILALFNNAGVLIEDNDDGSFPDVGTDSVTGSAYDTFLQVELDAGEYTVAVMQYDNRVVGDNLGNGFSFDGYVPVNFVDIDGFERTSFWAFDVLNVEDSEEVTVVPVPAAAWLMGSGLIGLIGMRRKVA